MGEPEVESFLRDMIDYKERVVLGRCTAFDKALWVKVTSRANDFVNLTSIQEKKIEKLIERLILDIQIVTLDPDNQI